MFSVSIGSEKEHRSYAAFFFSSKASSPGRFPFFQDQSHSSPYLCIRQTCILPLVRVFLESNLPFFQRLTDLKINCAHYGHRCGSISFDFAFWIPNHAVIIYSSAINIHLIPFRLQGTPPADSNMSPPALLLSSLPMDYKLVREAFE
ncbi:hypothetical protein CEXT_73381 [Caerostris extrusa]|uniref:Uncharacterized protein n=1 Tax=Caerostris extrusa TaxID=172846 RepID=A0AAV4XLE4_CAEEX|nr:hypothetical protein CEXT_73381 [Caerostris extrusa]